MALSPEIIPALGTTRSLDELYSVWNEHREDLIHARLVFSCEDGETSLPHPHGRWGRRGEVYTPYCCSRFQFISPEIESGGRTFPIDYDIFLDNNAANYMRSFVEGQDTDGAREFSTGLRDFGFHRFNWNIGFYISEVLPLIHENVVERDRLYRTALANKRLYDMDSVHFETSSEFQLNSGCSGHEQAAARLLGELIHTQTSTTTAFHRLHRAELLEMARLKLMRPKANDAARNLIELASWMDRVTCCWSRCSLHLAWLLFTNDSQSSKFFRYIQGNVGDVCGEISNMAWDLAFMRRLHRRCAEPGRAGAFMLPSLLTFDRPLSLVAHIFKVRGVLKLPDKSVYIVPAEPFPPDAADVLVTRLGFDPFDDVREQDRRERERRVKITFESVIESQEQQLKRCIEQLAASRTPAHNPAS